MICAGAGLPGGRSARRTRRGGARTARREEQAASALTTRDFTPRAGDFTRATWRAVRVARGVLFSAVAHRRAEASMQAAVLRETRSVEGARRARVLVVEDDRDLRDVLCELVASDGYDAIGARDGAEALAILRSGAPLPALVLLDLVMQGMNGWEFRAAQLREPALAAVPVIAMSASHELAGVPMLHKPFEVAELVGAMRAAAATTPVLGS
jgi:CheY-like chemotaxis protein